MSDNKTQKNVKSEVRKWIIDIVIIAVLAVVIRGFIFTTVKVKGPSMEPNYKHGQIVVAEKISLFFSGPKQGDVVACTYGSNDGELIIKRVIGMPGDIIDIFDNGSELEVEINGSTIDEDYIKEGMQQPGDIEYPYTVPDGCYFVMGDNRNLSTDSRFTNIGAIAKDEIKGKVIFKIWPIGG